MQVLNSAILSITLVLPVSSLMYRRRLPVGEQFRQYDIPFCVLMALILLLPPLVKKRLYRWQGRVCLILMLCTLPPCLSCRGQAHNSKQNRPRNIAVPRRAIFL